MISPGPVRGALWLCGFGKVGAVGTRGLLSLDDGRLFNLLTPPLSEVRGQAPPPSYDDLFTSHQAGLRVAGSRLREAARLGGAPPPPAPAARWPFWPGECRRCFSGLSTGAPVGCGGGRVGIFYQTPPHQARASESAGLRVFPCLKIK